MRREYNIVSGSVPESDEFLPLVTAINNYCSGKYIYIARKFDRTDYQWVRAQDSATSYSGTLYLFKYDGTLVASTTYSYSYVVNAFVQHGMDCTLLYSTMTTNRSIKAKRYYYVSGSIISWQYDTDTSGTSTLGSYVEGNTLFGFRYLYNVHPVCVGTCNNGTYRTTFYTYPNSGAEARYQRYSTQDSQHTLTVYFCSESIDEGGVNPTDYLYGVRIYGNSYSGYWNLVKTKFADIGGAAITYSDRVAVCSESFGNIWHIPVFRYDNTLASANKTLSCTYVKNSIFYVRNIKIGSLTDGGFSPQNKYLSMENSSFDYGAITNGRIWYVFNTSTKRLEKRNWLRSV